MTYWKNKIQVRSYLQVKMKIPSTIFLIKFFFIIYAYLFSNFKVRDIKFAHYYQKKHLKLPRFKNKL